MELLGDDTRRRIVYLLRARESTISQVAQELSMTPQAIYHHIKKLLGAGMVEVTREERVENFIETYYRATAEVFEFSWGQGKQHRYAEQRLKDALLRLGKLGINVNVDEEKVVKIVELQRKLEAIGDKRELGEKAAKLEDVDFLGKQDLTSYAKMITMTDKQYEDWVRLSKEFRNLLRSMLIATQTAKTKETILKPRK